MGTRPGAPGTSPHMTRFSEVERARRAEERAMQQQEQFKWEQERLESQRQAKMQSQKELTRQVEPTRISGGSLRRATTLGRTASHVPFPILMADEARRSEKEVRWEEKGAGRDDEEEARSRWNEAREAREEVQVFEGRLQATEEDLRNCLKTVRQGIKVVHRTKAFIDRQEDPFHKSSPRSLQPWNRVG
jgi:hypothetical protein